MDISQFRKVKIPFTLYDLFGYLLPGITFGSLFIFSYDAPKAFDLIKENIADSSFRQDHTYLLNDLSELLHQSPFLISVLGLLLAYIVGHILAAFSSYFLERVLVQTWLRYPTENMFKLRPNRKVRVFRNFRRPYTSTFIEQFKVRFESIFKLPLSSSNDIFWITFEFVALNCHAAFARSIHFLNLYGFLRNLSMTFLMSAIVLLGFNIGGGSAIHWSIISSYIVASIMLYWNYLKLLRRLNDEVYRGFYAFVTSREQVAATHNTEKQ